MFYISTDVELTFRSDRCKLFAGTLKKPENSCSYPQRTVWTLPSWPGYSPCTSLPRRHGLQQERPKFYNSVGSRVSKELNMMSLAHDGAETEAPALRLLSGDCLNSCSRTATPEPAMISKTGPGSNI